MTELEEYIKSYFGVVRANDIKTVASFFKLTTIKKGDYFLIEGKQCNKLGFIQSGFLRIYTLTDEKDITQWISKKGQFVTDLASFIFNTSARWTIQTLTDTEIYTISRDDYKKLSSLIPQWNELEKLFITRCFAAMESRIFSHLSMSSEERYSFFFESNKELFNQVPLQYIASMLGMTPETFSRIRKKMSSTNS